MKNPNRIQIRIFDGASKIKVIKASDWESVFRKFEKYLMEKFNRKGF